MIPQKIIKLKIFSPTVFQYKSPLIQPLNPIDTCVIKRQLKEISLDFKKFDVLGDKISRDTL